MQQRTSEWLHGVNLQYHDRQFQEPYRSTVAFCDWLEGLGFLQKNSRLNILDLACGQGANIYYMGKRFPHSTFTGVDLNQDIVLRGNQFLHQGGVTNGCLEQGDLYRLDHKYVSAFDGIVSFQTLSWLPDFRQPLKAMSGLHAKWMALTSLFYDGPLSCTVQVQDYDAALRPCMESYYNVYSLPVVRKYLAELGYSEIRSAPFEIDIDLPKPVHQGKGTYTEKLQDGHRLQISGPLLMPWHFIAAEKSRTVSQTE